MVKVYLNESTNQLYIDNKGRTTLIELPKGIDKVETAEFLQSETVIAIIDAIVKGSDRHGRTNK